MTTIDFEPKPGENLPAYANRLITFTMGCMDCSHVWTGTHGDSSAMFTTHRTELGKTSHRPWREATCLCGWHSGSEYREHMVVVVTTIERHLAMHAGLLT
jgi:hypothetical protein